MHAINDEINRDAPNYRLSRTEDSCASKSRQKVERP